MAPTPESEAAPDREHPAGAASGAPARRTPSHTGTAPGRASAAKPATASAAPSTASRVLRPGQFPPRPKTRTPEAEARARAANAIARASAEVDLDGPSAAAAAIGSPLPEPGTRKNLPLAACSTPECRIVGTHVCFLATGSHRPAAAIGRIEDAERSELTRTKLFTWPLLIGLAVTGALVIASLFVGVYDVFGAEDGGSMFAITRIPRTIALVLAGAAMAMCGLVMQLLTQNRFVEPTTTGTTEWAGLGLLTVMILFPQSSILGQMVGAVLAAFIGTMVFFAFLRRVTLKSSVIVPIIGIMLGAVVGAVSSFVALSTNMLQSLGIWFAGSFTSVLRGQYEPLWIVAVVVIAVFIVADRFTVAGLGEEVSTNIGVDYNRVVLLGTALVAIASGTVTVVVGALPFIGLIVPNIVSMFRGDDLRSNLPWVCLTGISIVTVCDLIGRTIIMPFEVPVSLILGVVGAAVFIALLVRSRGRRRLGRTRG